VNKKDGIHTLANLVIGDPMHVDQFPQSWTTQEFVASNVTQAKERNYHNQHPIDQISF
jgi:hypothetical protein